MHLSQLSQLCLALLATPLAAQTHKTAPNSIDNLASLLEVPKSFITPLASDGYLTFYLDNDLFAGSDEGYTNGARFSWISGSRTPDRFRGIHDVLHGLLWNEEEFNLLNRFSGLQSEKEVSYNVGLSLTQLIFTPQDLDALEAPPGERPYAGWLGLGTSLHAKDKDSLMSLGVVLGVIGPASLAEQSQDLIHDIRGFDKFAGWDSQIPNEITFDVLFDRKETFSLYQRDGQSFRVDGFFEGGVGLGTFRTNAYLGSMIRFGYNLPKAFADPRLELNSYSLEPFQGQVKPRVGWSLYGLLGARGTYTAHDATLDGPLIRGYDTGVTREPFVGEVYAGFGVRVKQWDFSYVHTLRTRRFEEDLNSNSSFGSVALRYRF